jgi:hypothetical protein
MPCITSSNYAARTESVHLQAIHISHACTICPGLCCKPGAWCTAMGWCIQHMTATPLPPSLPDHGHCSIQLNESPSISRQQCLTALLVLSMLLLLLLQHCTATWQCTASKCSTLAVIPHFVRSTAPSNRFLICRRYCLLLHDVCRVPSHVHVLAASAEGTAASADTAADDADSLQQVLPATDLLRMSTSPFLQVRLEKRRPIPLMAVRAYITFCLPSTLVFSTRRMCWKSSPAIRDCTNVLGGFSVACCHQNTATLHEHRTHPHLVSNVDKRASCRSERGQTLRQRASYMAFSLVRSCVGVCMRKPSLPFPSCSGCATALC